jgi:hypothetical protein
MNHLHIVINGKTVVDETQNNFSNVTVEQFDEFVHNVQPAPLNDKNDTFYYEGLFGDVYLMKKNCWSYRIYKFVMICILIATFFCLLPYFLVFFAVIFGIIAKLLGF